MEFYTKFIHDKFSELRLSSMKKCFDIYISLEEIIQAAVSFYRLVVVCSVLLCNLTHVLMFLIF